MTACYSRVSRVPASVLRTLRKSKWALIAYTILHSTATRWKFRLGRIDSITGQTHDPLPTEEIVRYVNQVYNDYLIQGRLSPGTLTGRRILELGPGDSVGVALRFVAAGARQAVCLDRFYAPHDQVKEREVYLALRDQLSREERRNFDDAIGLTSGIRINPERVRCVYGTGAEAADTVLEPASFDLIVSRGVLQEVYRIEQAFAAMDRLLTPGGRMVHQIDLRDYGLFAANGHHPLTLFTIPAWIYKLMAKDSDRSNRRLANYYRDKMESMGYQFSIVRCDLVAQPYIPTGRALPAPQTHLEPGRDYSAADLAMVQSIRLRLAPEFRNLSDEDLLTSAIFLVAQKPDHPATGAGMKASSLPLESR